MEKADSTPPYTVFDAESRKGSSKSKLLLITYSAVVSTLFVAVLLFGGVYYSQHLSDCEKPAPRMSTEVQMHEEHYQEDGHDVKQQVAVDPDRQVEVIRYKAPSDSEGSVVVLDYTRSLTSMYVPAVRECYLIGGIDRKIAAPFHTEDAAAEAGEVDEEETINYVKAADYPVVDHTMLPADLQDACADKSIYWLERYTQAHNSKLVKRDITCHYHCYHHNGGTICVIVSCD